MARYMIFEKTRSYDYKFKGTSEGTTANEAIKKLKARGMRATSNSIFIAIPSTQFMKHQYNPKKVKGKRGVVVNWSKAM